MIRTTAGWSTRSWIKPNRKAPAKWTSQNAMDLGIGIPTIDAAVTMRASPPQNGTKTGCPTTPGRLRHPAVNKDISLSRWAKRCILPSSSPTLRACTCFGGASEEYDYGLDMKTVARSGAVFASSAPNFWRICGRPISGTAGAAQPGALASFPRFAAPQPARRPVIPKAPVSIFWRTMALSSALAYFDALPRERRRSWVQAQRDYFSSHTYERVDKGGVFHTQQVVRTQPPHHRLNQFCFDKHLLLHSQ